MNVACVFFAAVLSTGVEIPDEGVPVNEGGHQYTTRMERCPAKIVEESGWKAGKEDWYDVAARCFDFLVDNVAIGFSEYDCFPAISAWDRHRRPMNAILWSHARDVDDKYSPGLRERVAKMREERLRIGRQVRHGQRHGTVS